MDSDKQEKEQANDGQSLSHVSFSNPTVAIGMSDLDCGEQKVVNIVQVETQAKTSSMHIVKDGDADSWKIQQDGNLDFFTIKEQKTEDNSSPAVNGLKSESTKVNVDSLVDFFTVRAGCHSDSGSMSYVNSKRRAISVGSKGKSASDSVDVSKGVADQSLHEWTETEVPGSFTISGSQEEVDSGTKDGLGEMTVSDLHSFKPAGFALHESVRSTDMSSGNSKEVNYWDSGKQSLESGVQDNVRQSIAEDASLTGQEVKNSLVVEYTSDSVDTRAAFQNNRNQTDAVTRGQVDGLFDTLTSDCCSMHQKPLFDPLSAYPEYPENYGNYKVCRQIAPGVKECLILETGEQIKCDKNKKKIRKDTLNVDEAVASDKSHSGIDSPPLSPKQDSRQIRKIFKITKSAKEEDKDAFGHLNLALNCTPMDGSPLSSNFKEVAASPDGSVENSREYAKKTGVSYQNNGRTTKNLGSEFFQSSQNSEESGLLYGKGFRIGDGCADGGNVENQNQNIEGSHSIDNHISNSENVLSPPISLGQVGLHSLISVDESSPLQPPKPNKGVALHDIQNKDLECSSQDERMFASPVQTRDNDSNQTDSHRHSSESADLHFIASDPVIQPSSGETQVVINNVISPPRTGSVPGYRSLQEQQACWGNMFQMLEEQHKAELKAQYERHQKNVQNMQEEMEQELLKQEAAFSQKLNSHKKKFLKEAAQEKDVSQQSYSRNNYRLASLSNYDGDVDFSESDSTEELLSSRSHNRQMKKSSLQSADRSQDSRFNSVAGGAVAETVAARQSAKVHPVSTLSPQPIVSSIDSFTRTPSMGAGTPERPANAASSRRLMKGGVYSTPMPLSKIVHSTKSSPLDTSPKEVSLDSTDLLISASPGEFRSSSTLMQELENRHQERLQEQKQPAEYLASSSHSDVMSPSVRLNLREKHAKHLSDLRAYYEKEIQELRASLASPENINSQSAYKRLVEENLNLSKMCNEFEEDLETAHTKLNQLEFENQSLEIKLADYSARLTESDEVFTEMRHHLDEISKYGREREERIQQLEQQNSQQSAALDKLYKMQEDQLEAAKDKQNTIQKLVGRYEALEKEFKLQKEALNCTESHLYDSKAEVMKMSRTISTLELEKTHLSHENDVMRKKAVQNRQRYTTTSLESLNNGAASNSNATTNSKKIVITQQYPSEWNVESAVNKPAPVVHESKYASPLLKAEQELRRLKQVMKSTSTRWLSNLPDDKGKQYANGMIVDLPLTPTKSMSPNRVNTGQKMTSRDSKAKSNISVSGTAQSLSPGRRPSKTKVTLQPKELNSPSRFDVIFNDVTKSQNDKQLKSSKSDIEATLNKIRAGELVARPEWENIYTSLTKNHPQVQVPPPNPAKSTEERMAEKLQTIEQLEIRYDNLQAEKRQVESSLSRIPISGRVDRKSRQNKEDLENRLDNIERELGSVRMSLKRYNVLKTSS